MKSINELLLKIKNKKLLVIFPHPDDESFASAGLILLAKRMGFIVNLLTLTKGGAGRVCINPNGRSLKEVRSEELSKAASLLKIDNLILKDFDDGKLKIRNGWGRAVSEEIQKFDPGIVITYDPTGITGHPDHINVGLGVKKIIHNIIGEKPTLLWVTFGNGNYIRLIPIAIKEYLTHPTYQLNMSLQVIMSKIGAMLCHRSQRYEQVFFIILGMLIFRKEWYHKVDIKKDYPYKYINFNI